MDTISAVWCDGSILICSGGQTVFTVEGGALPFNEPFDTAFPSDGFDVRGSRLLLFERIGYDECEALRVDNARRRSLPEKEIRRIANEIRYSRLSGAPSCYVVGAYTQGGKLWGFLGTDRALYAKLFGVRKRPFFFTLGRRGLGFLLLSFIQNPFRLPIKKVEVSVGGLVSREITVPVLEGRLSPAALLRRGLVHSIRFPMEELEAKPLDINNSISVYVTVDDDRSTAFQAVIHKPNPFIARRNCNYYYIPFRRTLYHDFYYQLRRSKMGALVLIKRGIYDVEKKTSFRILENNFLSGLIYGAARIAKLFQRKKVNIFYEKYSQKCDEGGYDLFLMASGSPGSENYFIMDETAPDYERIKDVKNVLRKYSLPYYWAVFRSDYFISTDTPTHIGLIRPNNIWMKKATYDSPFFMLQHGVTYLKAHEKNSPYVRGGQYSPAYMVASSEKERRAISDMLGLRDDQILITGLPIFSRLKYNHIGPDSPDIVTVMLTWKPYEEQIQNYEDTTYFKFALGIYEILSRYVDPDNILIVPHPVIRSQLEKTAMRDHIYNDSIFSALEKSKLLVTDYSSVCFNVFYQGGGVIFYQEDLTYYEMVNGPLVPADDEYFGHRAFSMEQFEQIVKRSVADGKIDLRQLRTGQFEKNALAINQFTDGKNLDRIYEEIKKRGII